MGMQEENPNIPNTKPESVVVPPMPTESNKVEETPTSLDIASAASESSPPPADRPDTEPKGNKKLLIIAGIIVLVLILAGVGYFAVSKNNSANEASTNPTPEETTSIPDPTADWETFSSPSFPATFKHPSSIYIAGSNDQANTFHVFLSNSPINIPETWDSPFVPVEMFVIKNQPLENKVKDTKAIFTKESLNTSTIKTENSEVSVISGVISGEGYFGGEKQTQALFQVGKDLIQIYFYPTIDNKFDPNLLNQILSTFKFLDSVSNSDWKTYSNSTYGLTFSYPADYEVRDLLPANKSIPDYENTVLFIGYAPTTVKEDVAGIIEVTKESMAEVMAKYKLSFQQNEAVNFVIENPISVSGIEGRETVHNNKYNNLTFKDWFIQIGDYTYRFSGGSSDNSTVEAIAKTINLTK